MASDPSAAEIEPAAAGEIFGSGVAAARAYVALLAGPGIERGLIGPREAGRLWSRHVLNCAVLVEAVPAGSTVFDVGSGAGLPGIPLAIAAPSVHVTLIEPLLRRATFLTETVAELGLANCTVVRGRAEEAKDLRARADVVTARAVAPLAKLARWSTPLLRRGGLFLVLKGDTAAAELERDRAAAEQAGLSDLEVLTVGAHLLAEPSTLIAGRRAAGTAGAAGTAARRRGGRSR